MTQRKYSEMYKENKKRDRFQYAAFQAFFRGAKLGGKSNDKAFVSAIVASNDNVTDKILAKNPNTIDMFFEKRDG